MAEGSTALSGSMEADVQGNGPVGSSEEVTDDSTPSISDSSDVEDLDSDVELPLEEFPPDEVEKADTTAQQYYEEGRDLQGIPWERLQVSREEYRHQRVQRYRNYMNCIPEDDGPAARAELTQGWAQPTVLRDSQWPYAFLRNWRTVASSIVHFQLRNLLWSCSAHDVCVVYDNRVQHWNCVTRSVSDVLDLRGWPKGPRLPRLGRVQVSTLCVHEGLVAAGGFNGELVLASMHHTERGPAWGDDEFGYGAASSSTEAAALEEQDDSTDRMTDTQQQQEQQQQGVLIQQQQQVHRAANQLFPGSRQLQDWQPQQQWPTLGWQQQQQQQQRQLLPPVLQQYQQQDSGQQQQHNSYGATQLNSSPQQPSQSYSPPRLQQQQHYQHQQLQHQQHYSSKLPPLQQQQQQQQAWLRAHGQQTQQQQQQEPLMGAAGPAAARVLHTRRVTPSENGITNGIEVFDSCNYGHCVMTANNDCCVRLFDVETCAPRQRLPFSFAVNYATLRPAGAAPGGGAVAAVVGDDPLTWLVDLRSGLQLMQLGGHRDFSFAAAWHPSGHLLATGNQDSTTRIWDLRSPSEPLAVLGGTMGAIRSLRFSPDGAYLAAAEPADFVHVYNVASGFACVQEVDLFGEVAGISFSPDSQAFFVAISDTLYNSLVQYTRAA